MSCVAVAKGGGVGGESVRIAARGRLSYRRQRMRFLRHADEKASMAVPKASLSKAAASRCSAWTVKRSENGDLGGFWLEGHGLSEGSETLGLSSRVRRAASSLQMQPEKPVAASHGAAKTPL